MFLRETSLYCRPDYVLTQWGAGIQPDGRLFVFGTDPKQHRTKRSEAILFADFDQCLLLDEEGKVFYIWPECSIVTWEGCEPELRALMATHRHIRKPESYIHPDDCPELRKLLSKRDTK